METVAIWKYRMKPGVFVVAVLSGGKGSKPTSCIEQTCKKLRDLLGNDTYEEVFAILDDDPDGVAHIQAERTVATRPSGQKTSE